MMMMMMMMRLFVVSVVVVTCVTSLSFEEYTKKFGKTYEESEIDMRRNIFEENSKKIANHPKDSTYKRGFNQFTDRTSEEMRAFKGLDKHLLHFQKRRWKHEKTDFSLEECPESLDYSSVLTPVKNQGKCGSCWTFAVSCH